MSEKARNIGTPETKNITGKDLKIKPKKKSTLSHLEILRSNNMEEPDIWNLPKH